MKRSLSLLLALSSWGLLATLGMAQQEQQQGAVIVWEVPYEELISGHPISLQVPPIQEDTVLYVLRVRVPEKLSLQQLEQLRKNWAHEVRKEISTMRERQVLDDVGDMVQISNRTVDSTRGSKPAGILVVTPSFRMVDSTRKPGGKGISLTDVKVEVANRMVDSTRRPRGVPYILVDHGRAFHTHQDTFGVQAIYGRRDPVILGMGQDTAGAGVDRTRYTGGFFLYRMGQDTFVVQRWPPNTQYFIPSSRNIAYAGVDRTRYTGGYFLYALPQDTTKPAELVDYYVPNGTSQGTTEPASAARINIKPLADRVVVEPAPAEERQIAYNAGVEGAIIVERRGNVLVVGNFTPTHVALPMPELELDPGDGPVCGIPGSLGQGEETVGSTARYTGYVLNQAIASGPKPSGKTLGAVTRQAPPQGGNQNMGQAIRQQLADLGAEVEVHRMAGPISLPRPSDVGIPEFRMMPPGGGAPVLWPNGNPPRDPDWPWVGVIGTPVLEGIEGEPGPGKPQNWCGTEYIWTGPRPKSPKELILTPVIPRPR
jgi:hypothetical protein